MGFLFLIHRFTSVEQAGRGVKGLLLDEITTKYSYKSIVLNVLVITVVQKLFKALISLHGINSKKIYPTEKLQGRRFLQKKFVESKKTPVA